MTEETVFEPARDSSGRWQKGQSGYPPGPRVKRKKSEILVDEVRAVLNLMIKCVKRRGEKWIDKQLDKNPDKTLDRMITLAKYELAQQAAADAAKQVVEEEHHIHVYRHGPEDEENIDLERCSKTDLRRAIKKADRKDAIAKRVAEEKKQLEQTLEATEKAQQEAAQALQDKARKREGLLIKHAAMVELLSREGKQRQQSPETTGQAIVGAIKDAEAAEHSQAMKDREIVELDEDDVGHDRFWS